MKTLREILRCLRSKHYADHNQGIDAMRIARMYGHCSRMESCRFCDGFHVEFIKPGVTR